MGEEVRAAAGVGAGVGATVATGWDTVRVGVGSGVMAGATRAVRSLAMRRSSSRTRSTGQRWAGSLAIVAASRAASGWSAGSRGGSSWTILYIPPRTFCPMSYGARPVTAK